MKKEIVGDCELYHGDCFDVLPLIHDVDLVLVDLPYGATQNKQDRPLSMGDLVLDFTAGSMTTAIACMNTGRKCICIEKDEDIFNNGVERVREMYESKGVV